MKVPAPGGSPWLTPEEAAAYAKVSIRTVEGWIHAGKVPVYYPTAKPRLRIPDLDAMILKTRVAPVGESNPREPARAR